MAAKPKKILFISHEASLSGATFVLLELMKWLKAHQQIEVTILLKEDGPVKEKFQEIGEVYLYDFPATQYKNRVNTSIYRRFILPAQKAKYRRGLIDKFQRSNFDLIYANTISVGEIIDFLKPLKCKVVTHVHELQYVIECMGAKNMQQVIDATSFYVAVCEEIKILLVQKYAIDSSRILVIPEFVNFTKIDAESSGRGDMSQQLNISAESFVLGGAGSVEWRKGVDLFVEVAIQVLAEIPNAYFIWVGNPREANIISKLNYDIKKAGLENNIKFIGPFKNPYPYYKAFDLFLLTSREDPYPLVCIENMYLNTPVICFERSGGAVSFITNYQFGKAVAYLNTTRMAEIVIDYIKNKKSSFPAIDINRLKEEHSVETIAPKVFNAIANLL